MFRMLLVEDSEKFRQTMRMVLLTYFPSVHIEEASDGEEALERIRFPLPDLVFMDINLPGENGIKVTRKIKSSYPDIPVIILTSYDIPEYKAAALDAGADHFLSKNKSTGEELAELVWAIGEGKGISTLAAEQPAGALVSAVPGV